MPLTREEDKESRRMAMQMDGVATWGEEMRGGVADAHVATKMDAVLRKSHSEKHTLTSVCVAYPTRLSNAQNVLKCTAVLCIVCTSQPHSLTLAPRTTVGASTHNSLRLDPFNCHCFPTILNTST